MPRTFAAKIGLSLLVLGTWRLDRALSDEQRAADNHRGDVNSERSLLGHWSLAGDCLDSSGHDNNGVNHGVDLATGTFNGVGAYIEVPASESLRLGALSSAEIQAAATNKPH